MAMKMFPSIGELMEQHKKTEDDLDAKLKDLFERKDSIYEKYTNVPLVHYGNIKFPDISYFSSDDLSEIKSIDNEIKQVIKDIENTREKMEILQRIGENTDTKGKRIDSLKIDDGHEIKQIARIPDLNMLVKSRTKKKRLLDWAHRRI